MTDTLTTPRDTYHIPGALDAQEVSLAADLDQYSRQSVLDRMTKDAVDAAAPRHTVDPSNIDHHRVEFGGKVINLAQEAPAPPELMTPEMMLAIGGRVVAMRRYETEGLPEAA